MCRQSMHLLIGLTAKLPGSDWGPANENQASQMLFVTKLDRLARTGFVSSNELLTMPPDDCSSNAHIEQEKATWVLSYSNALRREVQYRPASKPSQSAFAGSPKHGWNFIVQSVGVFTERRFGLLRKRQLPGRSCRDLLRKGGNTSLPWVCVAGMGVA